MKLERIFPCEQCGAKLNFSAATGELICPYCSHVNVIERQFSQIVERDYEKALGELRRFTEAPREITSLKCPTCAATFELDEDTHATSCPYCGSAVVNKVDLYRPIKPQALLPFKITKKESGEIFRKWLKTRWFAPNKLKRYSGADSDLLGIYVPFWTYDSDTHSRYTGRRGEEYQVSENYMATINGKSQMRRRNVTKVRWYDVSGSLDQHFDDVLVMGSQSLPDLLNQWDLENLVDYDASYLSGFESEVYQVSLESGFEKSKKIMERAIRRSIKRQIGGDRQRITSLSSNYSHITFKHILLPIYASAFLFNGKHYQYVINGRSGELQGERPYSVVKIASAVMAVLLIIGVIYYFTQQVQ